MNERNISFVQTLANNKLLDLNKKIYCSNSACTALNYLFTDSYKNRKRIDKIDYSVLNPAKEQIVIFDDDWWEYKRADNKGLMGFIKNNKNKIFIDPLLLHRFKIWKY